MENRKQILHSDGKQCEIRSFEIHTQQIQRTISMESNIEFGFSAVFNLSIHPDIISGMREVKVRSGFLTEVHRSAFDSKSDHSSNRIVLCIRDFN